MSDTTYEPGIYQDVDGDVIKVTDDGAQTIIAYGTPGHPLGNHIDMRFATKIADLVDSKPALEDGVYRERGGDTVLVRDGEVVEILATDDGCPPDNADHLDIIKDVDFLDGAVRLVAPERDTSLPADGFYADKDGDLVQVKGDQMRYLDDAEWIPLSDQFPYYGPYTPLVEAAAK